MSTTMYSVPARSIARKVGIGLGEFGEQRLTDRLGHIGLKHRRTSRNAPRPSVVPGGRHAAAHSPRRYGCVLSICGLP